MVLLNGLLSQTTDKYGVLALKTKSGTELALPGTITSDQPGRTFLVHSHKLMSLAKLSLVLLKQTKFSSEFLLLNLTQSVNHGYNLLDPLSMLLLHQLFSGVLKPQVKSSTMSLALLKFLQSHQLLLLSHQSQPSPKISLNHSLRSMDFSYNQMLNTTDITSSVQPRTIPFGIDLELQLLFHTVHTGPNYHKVLPLTSLFVTTLVILGLLALTLVHGSLLKTTTMMKLMMDGQQLMVEMFSKWTVVDKETLSGL